MANFPPKPPAIRPMKWERIEFEILPSDVARSAGWDSRLNPASLALAREVGRSFFLIGLAFWDRGEIWTPSDGLILCLSRWRKDPERVHQIPPHPGPEPLGTFSVCRPLFPSRTYLSNEKYRRNGKPGG